MSNLTHLNAKGEAEMVDVSAKPDTGRTAIAEAIVQFNQNVQSALTDNPKGDVLATARIAGIQAAKKCSDLIPLCHPLPISKVAIDIETTNSGLRILAECKTTGKTGVEMEALTAASIAALTIYDMCKAIDKGIVIETTRLLEKTGGKSGNWTAN